MTSTKEMKAGSVLQSSREDRRRGPQDQLPPAANSNKPLTPFGIEDILNKPSIKKSTVRRCPPTVLEKVTGSASLRNGVTTPSSPLCALEELASKTFKGLEVSVIQAAEDHSKHVPCSPADRDQIAQQLGLTNAQVITWFQNRRAKLKRDLEEMKADVESLKKIPSQALDSLVNMEDLDEPQRSSGAVSPSISPSSQRLAVFPQSPQSSSRDQTTDEFSEEDEEIKVDD
ncbi:UNVERIFIED_CONTAM: hypothetical protein FKN15_037650 [Acipenser sinensis]